MNTSNKLLVVGQRKSGTSMLANLLDGHPDLVMYPQEINLNYVFQKGPRTFREWSDLIPHFQASLTMQEATPNRDILSKVLFDKMSHAFKTIPMENASDMIEVFRTTYCQSVLECCDIKLDDSPRTWFGWKCVGSYPYYDLFFSQFFHGKILCIIRDPRGFYNSRRKSQLEKRVPSRLQQAFHIGYLYRWTMDWKNTINQMLSAQEKYGKDRVMLIRYEDVVSSTQKTISEIFTWLGMNPVEVNTRTTVLGHPVHTPTYTQSEAPGQVDGLRGHAWERELPFLTKALMDVFLYQTFRSNPFGYHAKYLR